MALVRTIVPDLIGGVSKQPDVQRFVNQFEEVDNAFLHFNRGFEKRAGSDFIKNLIDPTGTLKIHWVERSATQRYFFIFRENTTTPLQIYKIDGTLCTLTYQSGTGIEDAIKTYLGNTAPSNLRIVSFDDTTIVANTTITTAAENTTETYRYPTASTNAADDVINKNNTHNEPDWTGFDLPPAAINEFWYARSDAPGNPQGHYKSVSTTAQPWYNRIRTPWAYSTLDASTMPIKIVQTGDTTFTIERITWNPRLSGDGLTNPLPSFIGRKISDIAIHRNRLWIAAGEKVVGSCVGQYYNFWANTFHQIVDSDPIDIQLGSSQVSTIRHLIPFQKSLVVFTTGNQQYEIKAREALTPTTVSVVPATAYASPDKAKPIIVGSNLYWITNKGSYSQMFEYMSDSVDSQALANDMTAHCDTYISPDMAFLSASSSSDMIIAGDGLTNEMYVNFMFYQGEKKLQNAWCKFTLGDNGDDGKILSANFFGDTIYIVQRVTEGATVDKPTYLRLTKIECRTLDEYPSYLPRIDAKQSVAGAWNKGEQSTWWNDIPRVLETNVIFFGSEWNGHTEDREGYWIVPDEIVDNENDPPTMNVRVDGKYDEFNVWMGVNYETNCQISRQYVRDGRTQMPMVGTLTLKNMSVCHRDTGYYEIHIDPKITPQAVRVVQYVPKTIGSTLILGENKVSDNQIETFKVMSSANNVTINIKSNQPPPLNINAIEFATNFVERKTSPADR